MVDRPILYLIAGLQLLFLISLKMFALISLKKNVQQQILARSIYVLSALLVNVAIASFTNAAATGMLLYASAIFALIVLIGGMSLESALGYYYAGEKLGAKHAITMALFQIIVLLMVLLMVQLLFPTFFARLTNGFNTGLYLFVSGTLLTNFFLATLYAGKQYLKPNLVQAILNVLLVFILWVEYRKNFAIAILFKTYFYFIFLNGVVVLLVFMQQVKWKTENGSMHSSFKQVYQYAMKALWANVLFFIVYRLDYWFVHQYTTANDAGNYIQAARLAQMFILLPQFIAPVIFNTTANGGATQQMNEWLAAFMKFFFLMFSILFIVVAAGGQFIFTHLFGSSFNNMHKVLLLFIPGLFFLSCLNLLSAYFGGMNRVRINIVGAALAAVTTIAGNILIIPFYTIFWAALVSTLSYIVAALWALYQYKKMPPSLSIDLFSLKKSDCRFIQALFHSK
ncbi:MAG: hypothetical protein EO766_00850 [Hydrotalea sp. AMD]|nr:MAG: hypothetical protein EO766_00850 [Hydrotalea sp. AMD]